VYNRHMAKPEGTTPVTANFRTSLLEQIEKFRHRREFRTRTAAMESLFETALAIDQEKSAVAPKAKGGKK
jgi:hypothetical protein